MVVEPNLESMTAHLFEAREKIHNRWISVRLFTLSRLPLVKPYRSHGLDQGPEISLLILSLREYIFIDGKESSAEHLVNSVLLDLQVVRDAYLLILDVHLLWCFLLFEI